MDESTLLTIISQLRTQITEIKRSMRENLRQERSLQSNVDDKRREIERLNRNLQENRNLQTKFENEQKECKHLKKEDEGDYSKITYVYKTTNKDMAEYKKNYAMEITRKSFNMYDSDFDRTKFIKDQLESR